METFDPLAYPCHSNSPAGNETMFFDSPLSTATGTRMHPNIYNSLMQIDISFMFLDG